MKGRDVAIFFGGMVFMVAAQIVFKPLPRPTEKTVKEPSTEVLLVWREPINDSAPSQASVSSPRIVDMKVTAYCPCEKCCGKYADGKTSTGKYAWKTAGVAADPKLLPYGTGLNIPGLGILAVDDTGGAMRQSAKKGIYHIDVRFPSHQEALNWGVKNLPVEILK